MRCSNCSIKLDEYEEEYLTLDGTDEVFCSQDCLDEYEEAGREVAED